MRSVFAALTCVLLLSLPVARAQDEDQLERELGSLLEQLGGGETMTEQELEARVEEAGGLKLLRPLTVKFMSRAELKTFVERLFDEEYPIAEASREAELLSFFDLIPAQYELRKERARLLSENIAGFYNEKSGSKALYAVSSKSKIDYLNGVILAHEIRHAIQDQHFDLESKLPKVSDFDDRKLAVLALYEGDATVVMMHFMGLPASTSPESGDDIFGLFGGGSGDIGSAIEMAAGLVGGSYAAAPKILQRQLLLPYVEGAKFIGAINSRGGTAAVNAALASPPASSEQVLHPEKYPDKDPPQDLRFDASRRLAGQTLVFEGVLGEFYMQSLFDPETSHQAAAGWDGDYYQLFRDHDGHRTLIWKTAWDAPSDVDEFVAAWKRRASGSLVARGNIFDGKDRDGISIRIVTGPMSSMLIKSEEAGNLARFSSID